MYKVFVNDKPLVLTSGEPENFSSGFKNKIIPFKSKNSIDEALNILYRESGIGQVIIAATDLEKLWKAFCVNFTLLEAAGGVVLNSQKELLMIMRFKKWDLPKGKIEKGESYESAALREVFEETGVCDIEIVKGLHPTFHTFLKNNKPLLKKTFWFEMSCRKFSGFKLQQEEGIEAAKWMNSKMIDEALKISYASINELLSELIKSGVR